jgi:hypothetical protein
MDAREDGAMLSDNRRRVAIAAREPVRQGMGFGNERVQGEEARHTLWRNDRLDPLRPRFRAVRVRINAGPLARADRKSVV